MVQVGVRMEGECRLVFLSLLLFYSDPRYRQTIETCKCPSCEGRGIPGRTCKQSPFAPTSTVRNPTAALASEVILLLVIPNNKQTPGDKNRCNGSRVEKEATRSAAGERSGRDG
jgi:hypothetical protein